VENPINAEKERMLNRLEECLEEDLFSIVEWFYGNIIHQRREEAEVQHTFSTIQADESDYYSSEEEYY